MPFKIIVHADDFGTSKEISDRILAACDMGVLSSVSLVPNALAFDYAVEELKKRPHVRVSVHLNFLEGAPLKDPSEVDRLINTDGIFCHSFQGLWMKYILSPDPEKKILKEQVKGEMRAQISRVMDALGGGNDMNVDSHNHYHIIPFVFDALTELCEELRIGYIRIPQEKFFWCSSGRQALRCYFSLNMIKHCLLNAMSRGYKKKLDERSVRYSDYFIGVLFSGYMSGKAVGAGLRSLKAGTDREVTVEILFHPGRAGEEELIGWIKKKSFDAYYRSSWRDFEFNELIQPSFKHLIETSMSAS